MKKFLITLIILFCFYGVSIGQQINSGHIGGWGPIFSTPTEFDWYVAGVKYLSLTSSALTSGVPIIAPAPGSASTPGFAFSGVTNSGMFIVFSNQPSITQAGTETARFGGGGITLPNTTANLVFYDATLMRLGVGEIAAPMLQINNKLSTVGAAQTSILNNGSMASNITGWTGGTWAWNAANGGEALHTAGDATALTNSVASVSGVPYLATYTVQFGTAGTVTASFGGVSDSARSTTGTFTKWGVATSTAAFAFTPTAAFDGAVQLVSLQQQGPALTTCGTSPVVQQGSSNLAGTVTPGAATSACTLTFSPAFTNAPACVVDSGTTTLTHYLSTLSNTTLTATFSGNVAKFTYICTGLNE